MNIPNYHSIECRYHPPAEVKGSRVSLTSSRFKQRVYIPCDHALTNITDMAINWLKENGFLVAGTAESKLGYLIITDTFKRLKPIAKIDAYKMDRFIVPVPSVCTANWNDKDWIAYIDLHNGWLTEVKQ